MGMFLITVAVLAVVAVVVFILTRKARKPEVDTRSEAVKRVASAYNTARLSVPTTTSKASGTTVRAKKANSVPRGYYGNDASSSLATAAAISAASDYSGYDSSPSPSYDSGSSFSGSDSSSSF